MFSNYTFYWVQQVNSLTCYFVPHSSCSRSLCLVNLFSSPIALSNRVYSSSPDLLFMRSNEAKASWTPTEATNSFGQDCRPRSSGLTSLSIKTYFRLGVKLMSPFFILFNSIFDPSANFANISNCSHCLVSCFNLIVSYSTSNIYLFTTCRPKTPFLSLTSYILTCPSKAKRLPAQLGKE